MRRKKSVSSIIEITTSPKNPNEDGRSVSLKKYNLEVREMAKKIERFALDSFGDNLLSVKMALMKAVREVEKMMKERR